GEIGLARGYLNNPELTAQKFIANPYKVGERLYKTGDLARYFSDGNIDFLGRIDDQVKIRGYRIELREIETVLDQRPGLSEIVVLPRNEAGSTKRLVAYVVRNQDLGATSAELCSFLRAKLPDYMVPSAFVFLDSLPVTSSGKVDRNALPEPDQNRP